MKRIEILPGIQTSVLGFGCAPILGSVDAATARIALSAALDCGITHFDLARSYGYGQAERFVGRFLRDRRDEVTIATKFGIRATALAGALAPLKPLLRSLKKSKPTSQPAQPQALHAPTAKSSRIADLLHQRLPITADVMKSSLERSLRELGTDYVDFLLVHEPRERIDAISDVLAAAQNLKQAGKIRAFGFAIMMHDERTHTSYLDAADLLQFDNAPGMPHYAATLESRSDQPNIFFSPFRNRQPGQQPAEILKQLGSDFPKSITLCSMFKPEHIRQNAAAIPD